LLVADDLRELNQGRVPQRNCNEKKNGFFHKKARRKEKVENDAKDAECPCKGREKSPRAGKGSGTLNTTYRLREALQGGKEKRKTVKR